MQKRSKKPADTKFKQQHLPSLRPILSPSCVGFFFLFIGVPFVLIGAIINEKSANLIEIRSQHDGDGTPVKHSACKISSPGESRSCTFTMKAEDTMKAPIYLYYQLNNFHQNHRKYVTSLDHAQLLGCTGKSDKGDCASYSVENNCDPFYRNGSLILSPCGLVANSIFNDIILIETSSGQEVSYMEGIAWDFDENKYRQPDGFKVLTPAPANIHTACVTGKPEGVYFRCTDDDCASAGLEAKCKAYKCPADSALASYFDCNPGEASIFWYPEDDTTQ